MNTRTSLLILTGLVAMSLACAPAADPVPAEDPAPADSCAGINALTDAERAEGWTLLFDGQSLDGWHGYSGKSLDSWTIEDCAIKSKGTEDNYATESSGGDLRGDIVTDGEYENFELGIDWKTTTGGNSGLMYGVVEDEQYDAAWKTGPEYQFLDDVGFPEPLEDWQLAGANYAMHAASADKLLEPVGEWNTAKIVVNGNHIEHWLNGRKVLEFERWGDEWNALKNSGKWAEAPDYGDSKVGRIVLQDHGSVFWFRNIRIREIGDAPAEAGSEATEG